MTCESKIALTLDRITGLRATRQPSWSLVRFHSYRKIPKLTTQLTGSPPLWQDRPLPYTVPPDTGIEFIDQNEYRIPKAVFLPLFEAVNKVNKESPFDWPSVDIVTDRNVLRRLFRWASKGSAYRNFRSNLQLVGRKTVLMSRWEERTGEMYSGYTFGINFGKASTTPAPGCKDSTGHDRIVTYVSTTPGTCACY